MSDQRGDLYEFATRWELGLLFAIGCLVGFAGGIGLALSW